MKIISPASPGLACVRYNGAIEMPLLPVVHTRPLLPAPSSSSSRSWRCNASRADVQDRIATATIDDLDRRFCDDFECTSSPAVEQFVRSFARDTMRLRWGQSLFQPDVKYSDGFRSFQGNTKYASQSWLADNIQKPSVTIGKMKMLDKDTAQINWSVEGSMFGAQVDVPFTTVIKLNLLTGRIIEHKETWDLSKVPQPAATLASLGRTFWSLRASSADASAGVGKKVNDVLGSMDDSQSGAEIYKDPTDPTRFFQGNDNNQWNDYVSFAFLAALLYLATKAFAEIEKLN